MTINSQFLPIHYPSYEPKPEGPKHLDIAAHNLAEATDYLNSGAVELTQTHALIAIGHALTDLAKYGIEVFNHDPAL